MNNPDDIGAWLDRLKRQQGRDPLEQAVHSAIHRLLIEDASRVDESVDAGRRERLFARLRKEGLLDGRPEWRWRHYASAASVVLLVGLVVAAVGRLPRPPAPAEVDESERERGVRAVLHLASQDPATDLRAVLAEFETLHIPHRVVAITGTRAVLRMSVAASQLPVFRAWLDSRGLALEIVQPGEYRLIIGQPSP